LRSYPHVRHVADPTVEGIYEGEIEVEEKVDGSQFRIHLDTAGAIHFGSHRLDFPSFQNNGMFQKAVDICIKNLEKVIGVARKYDMYIFTEFVGKKKQNTLTYDKTPDSFLIVFDVLADQRWYNREDKEQIARIFGFDCIPRLWLEDGKRLSAFVIDELLKNQSYLGGTQIEGIVVKNYGKFFDPTKYQWNEGNFLIGKYVRQEFQEMNQKEHAGEHASIDKLRGRYNTSARWDKAIQKLTEEGKLVHNMKDLALIIPEVKADIKEECEEDIKTELYKLYGRQVIGSGVKGLPEYYNKKLLEK